MLLWHNWITIAVYEDIRRLLFYQIEMLAEFCFFSDGGSYILLVLYYSFKKFMTIVVCTLKSGGCKESTEHCHQIFPLWSCSWNQHEFEKCRLYWNMCSDNRMYCELKDKLTDSCIYEPKGFTKTLTDFSKICVCVEGSRKCFMWTKNQYHIKIKNTLVLKFCWWS